MNIDLRKTVKIMKAVSDRNRLRILKALQHRDGQCVCEIQHLLGIGQSTTSNHLRILEEAGLIYPAREGKWTNFFLNEKSREKEVRELLKMLERWLLDDRQIQSDMKSMLKADRSSICT